MCNMIFSDNESLRLRMKERDLLQTGLCKRQERLPHDWRVDLLPLRASPLSRIQNS